MIPNGRRLHVERTGMGKGAAHLPFKLKCEGFTIGLAGPMITPGDRIACVEIGSEMLMMHGHHECWCRACEILEDIGVVETDNTVSRVDVCVDLPGVPVEEYVELFIKRWRVTRVNKWGMYGEGLDSTGFTAGKGPLMIRIYDKAREALNYEGTTKYCVLRDTRWGGTTPKHATRVEFQLRRDALREKFSIKSMADLLQYLPSMTEYLTHEWFRLTGEDPDAKNKNQTKARDAECWKKVKAGFQAWVVAVTYRHTRKATPLPDVIALERQLVGVVETIAAVCPKPVREREQLLSIQRVTARRKHKDTPKYRISHKLAKLAAAGSLEWLRKQAELHAAEAFLEENKQARKDAGYFEEMILEHNEALQTHPDDCFCEVCVGR